MKFTFLQVDVHIECICGSVTPVRIGPELGRIEACFVREPRADQRRTIQAASDAGFKCRGCRATCDVHGIVRLVDICGPIDNDGPF